MSRMISFGPVLLTGTDQNITNGTALTFSQVFDLGGAVSAYFQLEFQYATAPTANTTIEVYALPSCESDAAFDVFSLGRNVLLGVLRVENVTTVQRLSVPVNPATLAAPYIKIAIRNNGTGSTATIKTGSRMFGRKVV